MGASTIYGELLPSTGTRALAIFEERARRITEKSEFVASYLVTGFRAIVALDAQEREALLERLWTEKEGAGRTIAIELGALWPLTGQRDVLWQSYCDLIRERKAKQFDFARQANMEAGLELLVRKDPFWLKSLIDRATGQRAYYLAVRLLASLEPAAGTPVWHEVRAGMREKSDAALQSAVLSCIARFADAEDHGTLQQMVTEGGHAGAGALEVLAEIAPAIALNVIEQGPPDVALRPNRNWLDPLLDWDFNRATIALRQWLMKLDPSGGTLALVWHEVEERIDSDTLALLLERLEIAIEGLVLVPRQDPVHKLLSLLGKAQLDPARDGLFRVHRDSPLSKGLFSVATASDSGRYDPIHAAARKLLRRIGGSDYEQLVLHTLSSNELAHVQDGLVDCLYFPTSAVRKRLTELAEHGVPSDRDDAPQLDLWRVLLAIDPNVWQPRLLALLTSPKENDVLLGLHLLREFAQQGDAPHVLACCIASVPGSSIEGTAMEAAITIGSPSQPMVERAIGYVGSAALGEAKTCWLNVLLRDTSSQGRRALDTYLAGLEGATSWRSNDTEALSIRLHQANVPPALWRISERLMRAWGFSSAQILDAFVDHDPTQTKDILLDRAFSAPHLFVSAQPEAINVLAKVDRALATQAFVQAWTEYPERRVHLAPSARHLDEGAAQAMMASLEEEIKEGSPTKTYRAVCVELRAASTTAWPHLLADFACAMATRRIALCPALGWTANCADDLFAILQAETDPAVRRVLYRTWRRWQRSETAVASFKANPTLEALAYAIDICDPELLYGTGSRLEIMDLVNEEPLLIALAEQQLVSRFNETTGSSYKRVVVRKRSHQKS